MVLTTTTLFSWLLLKSYVHIPDGYHIDFDRDPPRFARPVDPNNYVSLDLPTGNALVGGRVSLRFDEEDRALGTGASVLRLRFQWKW
jgi:hypothetical protein